MRKSQVINPSVFGSLNTFLGLWSSFEKMKLLWLHSSFLSSTSCCYPPESSCMNTRDYLAQLSILFGAVSLSDAFYLPGVAPHSFASGEQVELKVNKLRFVKFT